MKNNYLDTQILFIIRSSISFISTCFDALIIF